RLSLHDALPICRDSRRIPRRRIHVLDFAMDWAAVDFTIWPLHPAHSQQTPTRRTLAKSLRSWRSFFCARITSRATSHLNSSGDRPDEFPSFQLGHDFWLGDFV